MRSVPTLQRRLSLALGLLGLLLLLITMVSTLLIRNELFRQLELPLRRGPFPTSSTELRRVLIRSNEVCRFASFDNSTALNFWSSRTQIRPNCPDQVDLNIDFTKFVDVAIGQTGPAFQTTDATGRAFRAAVTRVDADVYVAIGVSAAGTLSTIRKLVVVQLIAIAVTLLALWLFGNWFTRRGIRSLEHIAKTANAIVAGDRSQRVVTDTQDPVEVQNVATALNEMLDDNEHSIQLRERSENKLRQFVSDASHELRTPLTSIQGYGELLETGVMSTPTQIVDVSQRVRSEANRMARLVEDMLQLANLDAEPRLNVAPHDLCMIVRAAASDAVAADPRWSVAVEAPHEVVASVDRDAIHQVVANLLTNARQHTPAGTSISVLVSRTDDDKHAQITVCDDGPGIASEILPTVFERFVRADPSRSRATGGAGLGLSIAHALVVAHNGTICAANRLPHGAEFSIVVPVALELVTS